MDMDDRCFAILKISHVDKRPYQSLDHELAKIENFNVRRESYKKIISFFHLFLYYYQPGPFKCSL